MSVQTETTLSKHIAGIIPVAKSQTDIDLLLHHSVLPIANNFYNIQRSIVECAYVGCSTIWVVCEDSYAPLIKKVCGDFVINMHDYERSKHAKYPKDNRRTIPIFYTPLSFKHRDKKGIGVSVLDGVMASFHVSSKISKWVVPYKYYIAPPYGVYNPEVKRSAVKSFENFFLEHDGRTALDGENLGFSLGIKEVKHCSYLYKKMSANSVFTLDKILNNDIVKNNVKTTNIDKYYNIENWSGYQQMWKDPLEIHPKYKFCFDAAFKSQERKLSEY